MSQAVFKYICMVGRRALPVQYNVAATHLARQSRDNRRAKIEGQASVSKQSQKNTRRDHRSGGHMRRRKLLRLRLLYGAEFHCETTAVSHLNLNLLLVGSVTLHHAEILCDSVGAEAIDKLCELVSTLGQE